MTNATSGFRLYLQVRIGKALHTDEVSLTTCLDGREVTIRARDGAQSISKAEWLVFEARGFTTESEARAFSERLRANMQLAALCSGPGVDTGSGDDAHGLLILPDDNTIFGHGWAKATLTSDPKLFLEAMHELADQPSITEPAIALSVRLLNLARVSSDPPAKIVLAVSAVETVAQDENWTDAQRALIKRLAAEIEDPEVKEAIKRMHKISIRRGIKRVLDHNNLGHLWGDWNDLYERRSRLFHGGREFTRQETRKLSSDAWKLCGKIILGIIKRKGFTLPSVASVNFNGI